MREHRATVRGLMLVAAPASFVSCLTAPNGSAEQDVSESQPQATLVIVEPRDNQTFVLTPEQVEIDITLKVRGFRLVPLGVEGDDMGKGQVRIHVDEHDCDDPGEPGSRTAAPYNRILPNSRDDSTLGMDYCRGGLAATGPRTHSLTAQLFHGETPLATSAQLSFATTYRAP